MTSRITRASSSTSPYSVSPCSESKSTAASAAVGLRLALHLLRYLDVGLEELCHAAVQADGLALVQVGFAVCGGDAFLCTRLLEAVCVSGGHERRKREVRTGCTCRTPCQSRPLLRQSSLPKTAGGGRRQKGRTFCDLERSRYGRVCRVVGEFNGEETGLTSDEEAWATYKFCYTFGHVPIVYSYNT